MKKTIDVVALGELLIDFTPAGKSELGFPVFECNPGGAPANVLIAISKQGGKTAFIGKVGNDNFGSLLKDTLQKEHVNIEHLHTDEHIGTTLAFVTLDETGNRSFSFFRNPGADIMLNENEIDETLLQNARIFHFGSLSCTNEPSRSATFKALHIAKQNNITISYDPNLRPALWKNETIAKDIISELMHFADIVKISEEEFFFLTGQTDCEIHAEHFMKKYSITLMFVTLGPKGAFYRLGNHQGLLQTYDVKVADTTGSGDSFMGACLARICDLNKNVSDITKDEIESIVDFANATGSMAATKKGGIPSIPTAQDVLHCIKNIKKLEA